MNLNNFDLDKVFKDIDKFINESIKHFPKEDQEKLKNIQKSLKGKSFEEIRSSESDLLKPFKPDNNA